MQRIFLMSMMRPASDLGVINVLAERLQLVEGVVNRHEVCLQDHLHLRNLLLVAFRLLIQVLGGQGDTPTHHLLPHQRAVESCLMRPLHVRKPESVLAHHSSYAVKTMQGF